ncbi:MAG: PKD domain-containing protein [Acidimicrobiales bacterium]|nr:PKD domain-containing protein [Acidimicrobiales bacterium]
MPSRRNTRAWAQRAVLAALVGVVLIFGLRANGSVADELETVDRSAWLVDPPMGTLVRVNALAGDVTTKIEVAKPRQQLSAAQLGDSAVVLNRSTGSVGRIDGATLQFQTGQSLASAGADLALVGNDGAAFAVDTSDGRLVALDPADLSTRFETSISPGQATPAVVDSAGRLWAFDAKRGEVIRFASADGEVKRAQVTDPVDARPPATGDAVPPPDQLTLVGDQPVLVQPALGRALRIKGDASAGDSLCLAGATDGATMVTGSPVGQPPMLYTLATASGELWVTDVDENSCVVSLELGDESKGEGTDAYGQPVALGARVFVPVLAAGGGGGATQLSHQVLVVAGNKIDRGIDLDFAVPSSHRLELFEQSGLLWFNDLQGSMAGVLTPSGPTLVVDKKDQSSISGTDTAKQGSGRSGPAILSPDTGEVDPNAGPTVGGDGTAPGTGNGDGTGGGTQEGSAEGGTGPSTGDDPTDADDAGGADGTSGSPPSTVPAPPGPAAIGAGPEKNPAAPVQPTVVPDALIANFTYSPAGEPTTETTLSFNDTSSGQISGWLWTFTAPDGSVTTDARRSLTRTLPTIGAWAVTLTVTNSAGKSDTTRPVTLQVHDPADLMAPNANFTWDPATPVVRQEVTFKDRSIAGRNSPVTAWFWEFGDGTTSNQQNPPTKTYARPDSYLVRLTVRNSAGASSTEATLQVAPPAAPLRPDFTFVSTGADPNAIVSGQPVLFSDASTGGPTSWLWEFGDGATATTPKASYAFKNAGDLTVKLTVSNATGSQSTVKTLKVSPAVAPPTAKIAEPAPDATVEVNKPLRFVSASTGNPTQLIWEWGDGTRNTEGASANHTFTKVDTYAVKLTATNAAGSTSATVLVRVTAAPQPPQPSFRTTTGTSAADPANIEEPIRFVNTSVGVGTFVWDFGPNEGTSNEREPSHTFKKTGTHHVTLTMTGPGGTRSVTGDVYIGPPPVKVVANFDYTPKNPNVGQRIQFVDQSTGTPIRWTWDFGDGSPTSGEQKPAPKTYGEAKDYKVTLTVADRFGAVTTKTQTISVQATKPPPPEARFSIAPAEPIAGTKTVLTDLTVPPAVSPPLSLGTPVFIIDGVSVPAPAGSRSVEHVFATHGSHTVAMKVCWATDQTNCTTTPTQTVAVKAQEPKPTVDFTVTGAGVFAPIGAARPVLLTNKAITFTDRSTGGTTRLWTIGTKTYTTQSVSDLVLAQEGTLSVSLTVTNSGGSSTLTQTYVVLADAPAVSFTAPATVVDAGTPVTFTDTSTAIPAAAVRTWDFGDGNKAVGTAAGISHTYSRAITPATVTLTITMGDQLLGSASRPIIVQPGVPTPRIAASVDGAPAVTTAAVTVTAGASVVFTDASTGPAPEFRAWTWSDQFPPSAAASVTRTFSEVGTYVVTLTAVNVSGQGAATMTVRVDPAPANTGAAAQAG